MEKLAKLIVLGGITAAGVAVAGYRAYKLKKLQEQLELEQEVIDITPDSEPSQN